MSKTLKTYYQLWEKVEINGHVREMFKLKFCSRRSAENWVKTWHKAEQERFVIHPAAYAEELWDV